MKNKRIYCELDSNNKVRNNSYLDQQIYDKYGSMIKELKDINGLDKTYKCSFNEEHPKKQIWVQLQNNDIYNLEVYVKCDCKRGYKLIIKEFDCRNENNLNEIIELNNAKELIDYIIKINADIFKRKEIEDCFVCGDDKCYVNYRIKIKEK